jgi:hypothetical protein
MVILLESIAFASLRTNQRYLIFVTRDKGSCEENARLYSFGEEAFPIAEFEPRAAEQAVIIAFSADFPAILDEELQAVPDEEPGGDQEEIAQEGGNAGPVHEEIGAEGQPETYGDQQEGREERPLIFPAVVGLAFPEKRGEPLEDEVFLLGPAFGDRDEEHDGDGALSGSPAEPQAQLVQEVPRNGAFVVAPDVEVREDIVVGIERDAYVRTGLLGRLDRRASSLNRNRAA